MCNRQAGWRRSASARGRGRELRRGAEAAAARVELGEQDALGLREQRLGELGRQCPVRLGQPGGLLPGGLSGPDRGGMPAPGGGCQFLLVMDYVVAAHDAYMTLPARKAGIIPGAANLRLARFTGDRIARHAIRSSRRLDCDRPEDRLVCDALVPPEARDRWSWRRGRDGFASA